MASNQINLGWTGVDVASQNAQALFFEEFLGQLLALLTLGGAMAAPIH